MYSRSYGAIESDSRRAATLPDSASEEKAPIGKPSEKAEEPPRHESFRLPPDYHGSMYPKPTHEPAPQEQTRTEEIPSTKKSARADAASIAKPSGLLSGLLGKISAEDILIFGLISSMLFGDTEENAPLLAVLLAIILT